MASILTFLGFKVDPLAGMDATALQAQITALQSLVTTQAQTITDAQAAIVAAQSTATAAQSATTSLQALRSSITAHVVGTGNLTTVTFTKTFDSPPGLACFRDETSDTALAVEFSLKQWITDPTTGQYTGAIIRTRRQQLLPSSLLLLTTLQSYDVMGGTAVGMPFTCIAGQRTA